MEKVNYDFLSGELKYLGFGDVLNADLNEFLGTEHPTFELLYRNIIDDQPVRIVLYFNRPDPAGYFFFTKYTYIIGELHHTFFIYKGKGVTVKEGFNLLNGRAVHKTRSGKNGQKYNEWIELDLTVKEDDGYRILIYPESHGFDLAGEIAAMGIETPSTSWDSSMLLRSLERGNVQTAFIKKNDLQKRVFIQADPKNRAISVRELPMENDHESGCSQESTLFGKLEESLVPKTVTGRKMKSASK